MKRIVGRKLVYACKKCGKAVDSATADVFKDDSICRKCLDALRIKHEAEIEAEFKQELMEDQIRKAAPEMYAMLRRIFVDPTPGKMWMDVMAEVGVEFQALVEKIDG